MSPQNKDILDQNLHHWHKLSDSGVIQIIPDTAQQLLNVLRAEYNPGASCCIHCGNDIANMIRQLYSHYKP